MVKQLLKMVVPASLRAELRQRQRDWQAAQRRRARNRAHMFSQVELEQAVVGLGIRAGDCLMVHSALGQFNNIEGGAQGVLQVLWRVLGAQGTLVVPSFPHWSTVMETGAAFDVRATPSTMGVLTELVRHDPRARRSLHPTHPVVAVGPLAEELTRDHAASPYAFGVTSPFFRHAQAGGKILLLGVNLNSLTSFHVYEDLIAPAPWLPVYEEAMRAFELRDRQGVAQRYKGFFHSLEMTAARDVMLLRDAFVERAEMRTQVTDYSELSVLAAKPMVQACLTQLAQGFSAYGPVNVPPEGAAAIERAAAVLA